MLSRWSFFAGALKNAFSKGWTTSGVIASVAALIVPAVTFNNPEAAAYKIFVGWWVPLPDLVWVVPLLWLLAFSGFSVLPAIYEIYRDEVRSRDAVAEELRARIRQLQDTQKRPLLILKYGVRPGDPREQRVVYAKNVGAGHAREVQIETLKIGDRAGEFDAVSLIEAGEVAEIRFTATQGDKYSMVFGGDFFHFANDIVEERAPSWDDRDVVVTELVLRYKDIVGTEYDTRWSVNLDIMFAATNREEEAISFREHGVARNVGPTSWAV